MSHQCCELIGGPRDGEVVKAQPRQPSMLLPPLIGCFIISEGQYKNLLRYERTGPFRFEFVGYE